VGVFAGPDVSESGLVLSLDAGNLKSYPGSGTTWTDLSGNGNTGTLVNGVGYNSSNLGSLVFDQIDDTVTILQSSSTNITSNTITFGGWVYPTISNKYQHIIVKNIGSSRQYGMWLSINGTSQIFRNLNGVISQGNVTLSSPWMVNTWNYIILTYNGSTIKIYLNSNEVYSQNASGNIVNVESNVNIGGEPSQSFVLNGNIAQVSIYNRALTAQEIQQNFNATKSRFGL
jgi:hypothetical protein